MDVTGTGRCAERLGAPLVGSLSVARSGLTGQGGRCFVAVEYNPDPIGGTDPGRSSSLHWSSVIRSTMSYRDNPLRTLLHSDSLRGRLARGTIWSTVGAALAQGLGMAASIVTARLLGQTVFGEYGMIRSTVMMVGVLGGSGLGTAATKHLAEQRLVNPARAGRQIGLLQGAGFLLASVATLLCFCLAAPLARVALNAPQLTGPLRLAALLILFSVLGGIQRGALVGLERFRTVAWLNLVDGILNIALVIPSVWKFGLLGGVAGLVAAAAAGVVVKALVLRRECRRQGIFIQHRGVRGESAILWSFALPTLLVGISTLPFEWLARVPLTRHAGSFAELGIFSAAYAWGPAVMFLPSQIVAPAIPLMAGLYSAKDHRLFARLARTTVLLSLALGVIVAVVMVVFAGPIMGAYGPSFAARRFVLVILLAAYAVASGTTLNAVFLSTGRMWLLALHYGVWGIVLVGCSYLFRQHGAGGLAFSYLISYGVLLALQVVCARVLFFSGRRAESGP